MKYLFSLILVFHFFVCCYGGMLQSYYTTKDGLLSNTIDYITMDTLGMLYLSTPEGLQLFSGSFFSLPGFSKEVSSFGFVKSVISLDEDYMLICSLEYDLVLYNKKLQSIKQFNNYPFLRDVIQITKDKNGVLWFASSKGKIWYVENYKYIIDDVINVHFVEVDYSFAEINKMGLIHDKIYVCTARNDFFLLDYCCGQINIQHVPLPTKVNSVYCAVSTSEGKIVIGTDNGAYFVSCRECGGFHVENTILSGKVVRCIEDTDNGIYLGTEGDGLFAYKNGLTQRFVLKNQSNFTNIISSYYDKKGYLWLGSWNGGLVRLMMNNQDYKILYKAEESTLLYNWCFESFPNDSVTYVGTHSMGLAYFSISMDRCKVVDDTYPCIKSLYADSLSNDLYVGTFGSGLRVYDLKTKAYEDTHIKEIEKERVYVIYPYSAEKLLIGTSGKGLWLYDKINNSAIQIKIPYVYGNLNIRDVKPDTTTGGILISTYNNGIYHLKLNPDGSYYDFFRFESSDKSLFRSLKMLNDNDDILVTTEKGLYKIERGGGVYSVKSVSSIRERLNKIMKLDNEHYIVSSHSGLFFLNSKFETLSIISKGETISDVRYNKNTKKLEIAGTDHIILLGGKNLKNNSKDTRIYFRSISINGELLTVNKSSKGYLTKAIEYTDKILLSPTDNNIDILFSCIQPDDLVFNYVYYKLDGLESNWNKVSDPNLAIRYNSIPPGKFKLRVRVQSVDNEHNERTLIIEKSEFWYKTGLAYFSYVVILLTLIGSIIYRIKLRERKLFFYKIQEMEEKKKLEVYDQKLRFVTNISHDLKTPLTLVLSPLTDMISMPDMPDKFKPRIQSMIWNGNNLLRKINKIINYKDMELYDGSRLELEKYNLQNLIYEIIIPFKAYAESQGIAFHYHFVFPEHSTVMILTEKNKFESVFENLLSNAIKYTPRGGMVKVNVISDVSVAHISIADTGSGIPEEALPHIFDRYYCAKDNNGGTGIGLFLVKRYVDLLGGNIQLSSVVGKGTMFSIDFPVSVEDMVQNQGQEDNNADVIKLLFVEDNDELRAFFIDVFSSFYTVLAVSSADEAVELACKEMPDLIVSDYMMPVKDGLELCNILKNNILTSHIPFVMLSSLNTDDFRTRCWQAGVDLLEEKPFNTDILKLKFTSLIKNRIILKNKYQYPVTKQEKIKVEKELSDYDKKFIDEFNRVIEDNLENSELSIDDVAVCLKMTHDQLYRKVKALTGISVNQYIRSFRLRKAAKLMCETGCSVTEVLYTTGFSSPSYFTKCFKKEFGVLPSEYIEKNL